MNKRKFGKKWEKIVENYYLKNWFKFLDSNFAIRNWEIDLIFGKNKNLHFVEVKVIDCLEDQFNYITKKKLKFLEKTINYYLSYKNISFEYEGISLDIVFVKNNKVCDVFQNTFLD